MEDGHRHRSTNLLVCFGKSLSPVLLFLGVFRFLAVFLVAEILGLLGCFLFFFSKILKGS